MNRLNLKGLPILLIGILITISCADDPLKVGIEILPSGDRFVAKADTLKIKCTTKDIAMSGYSTSNGTETDNCPIGHVKDSTFGETWAQLFTYFNRGNKYYKIDTTIEESDEFIECAIYLNIEGSNVYGTKDGFKVIVHPLTKAVTYGEVAGAPKTNYIVKSDLFPFNENPISMKDSTFFISNDPESEIPVLDSGNYIKVKLDKTYGEMLMNTSLTQSADFNENFPGFYLYGQAKTGTSGGLNNFFYKKSKLLVRFKRPHGSKDGVNDTILYAYHDLANYQGFYKHDYNNASIKNAINDSEESQNFYLQSMDGVKGLIDLVELDSFRNANMDKIGINLAELVFPVTFTEDTSSYSYPKRIAPYSVLENDNFIFTADDYFTDNALYFNGFFDSDNDEYRVNITESVHKFMRGEWNDERLYLNIANNNFTSTSSIDYKNPSRIILNSGNHATKPAYLRLIYTLTNY